MKSKKSVKSKPIGYERLSVALVLMLEIMLVFTFIDYVVHTISPDYGVPNWYFTQKIIYGTIVAFITYLFIRSKPIVQKSLILSAVISVLLQLRYLILGYSMSFVLMFLVIHFVILYIVSWVAFKITDY